MLQKTSGIVLHQIKYADSAVIAHIYTESNGRQSFLIRGARSKSSAYRINLLQPLFVLDMEIYHRGSRELQKVRELRNKSPFTSIPYDPVKTTLALFLAEVLYRVLKEQEPNPGMFSFLVSSIETLDALESDYSSFHLLFLLKLARHLGFFPAKRGNEGDIFFDLRSGTFVSIPPDHGQFVGERLSGWLNQMLVTGYQQQADLQIGSETRSQLLEAIVLFYSFQLEGFGRPSSLDILKEVYRG